MCVCVCLIYCHHHTILCTYPGTCYYSWPFTNVTVGTASMGESLWRLKTWECACLSVSSSLGPRSRNSGLSFGSLYTEDEGHLGVGQQNCSSKLSTSRLFLGGWARCMGETASRERGRWFLEQPRWVIVNYFSSLIDWTRTDCLQHGLEVLTKGRLVSPSSAQAHCPCREAGCLTTWD